MFAMHMKTVYYCLRILSTKLNPILDLSTNQNAWSIAEQETANKKYTQTQSSNALQMKSTHEEKK